MKCMFSINMYSGNMPPERELKPEEVEKLNDLVSRLHVPYQHVGPKRLWGLGSLSTDSYSVFWLDERCVGNPDFIFDPFEGPWMGVQCQAGGAVHVYRKEEEFRGVDLKDTVGLWEYLATIGVPLLARYYRDMDEGMSEYYEKVLGVPYEKKV